MAEEVKEKFELLTEIARDLSMQFDGINTDSRRKRVSTHYLAKLVHTCWSLTKLLPLSKEDFLDLPSIAAVCRNIIELTNLCWYYCIENISELESEFRFLLYDFHDATSLSAIFKKLSFELDEPQKLDQEKEGLKLLIMNHQQFDFLSEKDKIQVKKGRKATLLNHFQIIENRGINVDYFHGMYKLMSTHTHSTATSVNFVVNTRLNSSEMDEAFLDFTIDYTSGFIAEMILEIGSMWNINFAKSESQEFIEFHASKLYLDI